MEKNIFDRRNVGIVSIRSNEGCSIDVQVLIIWEIKKVMRVLIYTLVLNWHLGL